MAWFRRNKEKSRFYLLPGMGGRNLMRKQRMFMRWAIACGIFVSAILAGLLYWLSLNTH